MNSREPKENRNFQREMVHFEMRFGETSETHGGQLNMLVYEEVFTSFSAKLAT